jgi:hypothetical protein
MANFPQSQSLPLSNGWAMTFNPLKNVAAQSSKPEATIFPSYRNWLTSSSEVVLKNAQVRNEPILSGSALLNFWYEAPKTGSTAHKNGPLPTLARSPVAAVQLHQSGH